MKISITRQGLKRIIREALELDLEVGDVILTGKFKNKRKVVKKFGKDDLGQPTINGMKALNFRIEKLMPKDKWSKESKEALEFAEKVDESINRITLESSHMVTPEEIELQLVSNAQEYHKDPALRKDPGSIKLLLQDDFMDDFGHMADPRDYEDIMDSLSMNADGLNETVFFTDTQTLFSFLNETSSWEQRRAFEAIFGTPARSRMALSMVFEHPSSIEEVIREAEEPLEEPSEFAQEMMQAATEDEKVEVPAKNFVIMVGGPGTGKGGVINTDKFMGSTVDATKGVMASQDYLEDNPEFGVQIQDEVDGFLRIEQRAHADEVHAKLNQAAASGDDAFQQVLSTLFVTDNPSIDLRAAIAKSLNKGDWKEITAEDWKNSGLSKSSDAMVGPSAGVDSLKKGGGDGGITTQFMLLRSKWGEPASAMSLKNVAVKKHGDALKGKIQDFIEKEVEASAEEAGDELPATRKSQGVYILDSAGEDLPTQDYEGQLQTAKDLGFKTYIVWLNTGPEVSYVGNLERSVTGGKRAVPAGEIKAYYDAAEGGMAGGKSARDYFTSLTQQRYTPSEDADPHAKALGEVPLLDKVLVLNQKDELDAAEVSDIATKTCVNPAGMEGQSAGTESDPAHNIDNPLCDPATAKEISGMDDIDFSAEASSGAPKNYNELVTSLEKELMDQVVSAIEGNPVELPSSVQDAMGSGFKDAIKNVSKEYDKQTFKGMSDEELKAAAADLGIDVEELAKDVIAKVKDTRQNAIRGLIKKGKGSGFDTEEISAESISQTDDIILERWQKLAGILKD